MDTSIENAINSVISQYGEPSWGDLPENFGQEIADIATEIADFSEPTDSLRSDLDRIIAMCHYVQMAIDGELVTA